MAEPEKRGGVVHHYGLEQLLEFRAVPAADKLAWLEEMRQLLCKALTPEKIALLERFRSGDL